MSRRIRIGIDTGGTFTDVVAFDEDTGELVTTKTPSTPGNPADGFLAGIDKVLGLLGATGADIDAVSHGTTVATNQLLEGKVDRLGFVTNTGYEAMLEIARQSVPDGYGNSYFWVKPPRIVPRDLVKGVEGRLDVNGEEVRPFDEDGARAVARWFRDQGIDTLGVCFLHAYANPVHEERMRAVLHEEHPHAVVSLSSEVLREYREYERAMTTLVDAAVKPRLSAYVTNIKSRLTSYDDRTDPVLRDEVQRRRALGRRGRAPADHHGAVRPGGRCAGRGADRESGRLRPGADLRRRRYVDRRVRRHRRRADADHRGLGRRLPLEDPDDRRGHRRRGWRLDRLALARGHSQGRAAVGRRRPRPALLRQGRHRGHDHRRPRGARPDPAAPARRRDPARRRRGAGRGRGAGVEARPLARGVCHRHPRDLGLEPGQRAAPGHGQAGTRRPRLHAHHVRRLRLAAAVPADGRARHPDRAGAAQPRQRLGVRPAHRRRQERLRPDPRRARRRARPGHRRDDVRRADPACRRRALRRGLPARAAPVRPHRRPALLRPGLRGAGPRAGRDRRRRRTRRGGRPVPRRAQGALRLRLLDRPHPAGGVGQPPRLRHWPDPAARDPPPFAVE